MVFAATAARLAGSTRCGAKNPEGASLVSQAVPASRGRVELVHRQLSVGGYVEAR